ncbi:MAG TPA: hypothetical protein VMH50_01085 [Thermoleophilia bacterium]|nr:hypothetical protein [Thermoleophilia bacterium]
MDATWRGFGEIEIDGVRYMHDVVIEGGKVSKRSKKPSKRYRDRFGHTPLSPDERIPWGGRRLIIGTGAYGSLPVMPEVEQEAQRRGVELVATPTEDALGLVRAEKPGDVWAVLHVTC